MVVPFFTNFKTSFVPNEFVLLKHSTTPRRHNEQLLRAFCRRITHRLDPAAPIADQPVIVLAPSKGD